MKKDEDPRCDVVDRMIRDSSPEEFVDWMIKYHNLPQGSAETIICNLREQFKWHRLQGRLDRLPTAAVIAEVWGLRQSVKALEKPKKDEA